MDAKTLLKEMADLDARKAEAVKGLLSERADLEKSTTLRLKAIATELQALGWRRTRKSPAKKEKAAA
jgi:hypothetical protein